MKANLSILGIVIFMALFGCFTYQNISQMNENNHQINHTNEVISQAEKVQASLFESDALFMRYIVSKEIRFKIEYENEMMTIDSEIEKLKRMTADNPNQQIACENLLIAYNKRSIFKEKIMKENNAAMIARPENNQLKYNIINVINTINSEEQRLLKERMKEYTISTTFFIFVTGFGLIIMAGLCFWAGNYYSNVCRRNDLESFINKIKN